MDFSGKWDGFYIYLEGYDSDYFGEKVKFSLILEEEARSFKGSCQEEESEFSVNDVSKAEGFIDEENLISFVLEHPSLVFVTDDGETYKDENQTMTVRYEGEYDEITDTFFGNWNIDEMVHLEGEEFYLEGAGVWKMTRNVQGEKGSIFSDIYQSMEDKFTNVRAIKNTVLFNIEGKYIHINGNGSANSLSKSNQEADCMISISEKDMMDILEKKSVPAFLIDKDVKTDGNIGVIMKVQTLLGVWDGN